MRRDTGDTAITPPIFITPAAAAATRFTRTIAGSTAMTGTGNVAAANTLSIVGTTKAPVRLGPGPLMIRVPTGTAISWRNAMTASWEAVETVARNFGPSPGVIGIVSFRNARK